MADIIRKNPFDPNAPVAPIDPTMPDIVRQNPFGEPAIAPPSFMPTVVPPTPTTPLNDTAYLRNEIQSGDIRKGITQDAANITAGGLQQAADVQSQEAIRQQQQLEEQRLAFAKSKTDNDARDVQLRQMIHDQAAKQIDPEGWWHSRDTGQKVLAGIGMILGGFNPGGGNPAMSIIGRAIDADIAAQKDNIANGWKGVVETRGANDTAFNRDQYYLGAQNTLRIAGYEVVKLQLGSIADNTKSGEVKQAALMARQDLSDQQDKLRHQQYVAGQQQILANVARLRKLGEKANEDRQAKVLKDGVDPDQADWDTYSQPIYRDLILAGMAPAGVMQVFNARTKELQQPKTTTVQIPLGFGTGTVPVAIPVGKGLSQADAMSQALQEDIYKKYTGPVVPGKKEGQESQEQIQNRSVFVDGKQVLALNKKAADEWQDYARIAPVARDLINIMKANQAAPGLGGKEAISEKGGDPAKYEAARAKLIEITPALFGYARGPSVTQAQVTFGPEAIPDYTHWYSGGLLPYNVLQNRASKKLDDLANTLDIIDKEMKANTFGSEPAKVGPINLTPSNPSEPPKQSATDLNQKYGATPSSITPPNK